MKMKAFRAILLVAALVAASGNAANTEIKKNAPIDTCARYFGQVYDVNVGLPKGFVDKREYCEFRNMSPKQKVMYTPVFKLYCGITPADESFEIYLSPYLVHDLRSAVEADQYAALTGTTKHIYVDHMGHSPIKPQPITQVASAHVLDAFNADSVCLARPKLNLVFKNKYKELDVAYLYKRNRPVFAIFIFSNADGERIFEENIAALSSYFKFGNDAAWEFSPQLDGSVKQKYHLVDAPIQ